MLIDCDTCTARDVSCHDCVVSVLLGMPEQAVLPAPEQRALAVLAESGMVPPLRLVAGDPASPAERPTRRRRAG